MSVKTHIILIFSILLALLIAIIFTMGMMTTSRERVAQTELHRFETGKLADQLRQSSDDLTRMVRTYAVTGDPVFEKYFYEILAIRDGKAPRPENYGRIYWDFVTANDERPSPFGPPAALIDLMKEIGLTPEELAKLEDAKKNSDDLTRLEAQAFGAMKGLFVDDNGELTIKRVPDPAYAHALLHGEAYHNAKLMIMRPIGEFMEMIDKRTLNDVRQARVQESMYRDVVMVLVAATVLFSLFAFFHIRRRVITPVVKLSQIAKQVEKGHLEARADVSTADEIGILNNAFNQMMERTQSGIENLEREIGERKQAEEKLREAHDGLERHVRERTAQLEQEITDRRRAEQALEASEQRLSVAIDNMAVGIVVIDENGTITEFNPFAEGIFGYEAAEVVGKSIEMLMPERYRSERDQCLRTGLDTGAGEIKGMGREVMGLRKSGETFPMRFRVGELKTADGSLFVGTVYDLTEIKQMESQLRQAQKMDAIGQLTGGIAHDFNNLLGIVMGNLELLQRLAADDPEMSDRVQKAIRGTERGVSLTKKLLGFSRKGAPTVKLTNVNAFIENLHELIAKSLTPSIKVEQHLAGDLWPVEIDSGEFEDAILNLSLNARDAMPGGGTLVIETANKFLDETYLKRNPRIKAGEFVLVSLSDTGAGMSREIQERIFEPFYTTKDQGKGTGLGMSMVYGFVKRSGGHVKVYSEVGEGTIIHIYLPRVRKGTARDEEPTDIREDSPGGSETILVVDDEADLVDIAVTYLEELGYRTLSAIDGTEALKILEDHEDIDLMFADVIMPGGPDGYKLAKAARKIRPALKVLLTSGFSRRREELKSGEDPEERTLARKLLHKPYTLAELAGAIRHTLDIGNDDET